MDEFTMLFYFRTSNVLTYNITITKTYEKIRTSEQADQKVVTCFFSVDRK